VQRALDDDQHAARTERLPDKVTIRLRAGDVLRLLTLGGGGLGTNSNPGTDGALES
jgi:N-methylhydantoinase B/oxoprolinase/acetone carboxylase alpha subunit